MAKYPMTDGNYEAEKVLSISRSADMIPVLTYASPRLIPATIQCFRAKSPISSIRCPPVAIIIVVAYVIVVSEHIQLRVLHSLLPQALNHLIPTS